MNNHLVQLSMKISRSITIIVLAIIFLNACKKPEDNPVAGILPATVSTLAGSSSAGFTDATGLAASFKNPQGVAVDASGNIYVADAGNNAIRKITAAGLVITMAGTGSAGAIDDTTILALFNNPMALVADDSGNVYVADTGNHLIRKITNKGRVITFAGSGTAGAVNDTGITASFNAPQGIARDTAGNIYVGDTGNHLIRKITSSGIVSTFAGSGIIGSANGTGSIASFYYPAGLSTDVAGNIFVADSWNHLIRKITPGAAVTTLAGSGTAGALNAIGIAASFNFPKSVAADVVGNVYVADGANNLVRKISADGTVATFAGSGNSGSSNGTASSATFNNPYGIAVTAAQILYVGDTGNNLIRKLVD